MGLFDFFTGDRKLDKLKLLNPDRLANDEVHSKKTITFILNPDNGHFWYDKYPVIHNELIHRNNGQIGKEFLGNNYDRGREPSQNQPGSTGTSRNDLLEAGGILGRLGYNGLIKPNPIIAFWNSNIQNLPGVLGIILSYFPEFNTDRTAVTFVNKTAIWLKNVPGIKTTQIDRNNPEKNGQCDMLAKQIANDVNSFSDVLAKLHSVPNQSPEFRKLQQQFCAKKDQLSQQLQSQGCDDSAFNTLKNRMACPNIDTSKQKSQLRQYVKQALQNPDNFFTYGSWLMKDPLTGKNLTKQNALDRWYDWLRFNESLNFRAWLMKEEHEN